MKANVVYHQDVPLQALGGGVSRRILAYNEQLMMVEVVFEQGGVGTFHTHPHVQCTYVQSGRFRFTLDGEEVEVGAGDSLCFPSGIPHGTLCLEKGVLLDVFTPMRADFLKKA